MAFPKGVPLVPGPFATIADDAVVTGRLPAAGTYRLSDWRPRPPPVVESALFGESSESDTEVMVRWQSDLFWAFDPSWTPAWRTCARDGCTRISERTENYEGEEVYCCKDCLREDGHTTKCDCSDKKITTATTTWSNTSSRSITTSSTVEHF